MMKQILEEFMASVVAVLREAKSSATPTANKAFFDYVRQRLFNGKLTAAQVSGMEAKLAIFQKYGLRLSHAAYALATSYHETARRMQPVREGLNASDAWRKKNLRYYPWYGRGDVQLTWEDNYRRADKELSLDGALVSNLDLALDPAISAEIMVKGMAEGWFSKDRLKTPHTLSRHLPNDVGTLAQFRQARRIINLMDKADLIAGYAIQFQEALKEVNYGKKG